MQEILCPDLMNLTRTLLLGNLELRRIHKSRKGGSSGAYRLTDGDVPVSQGLRGWCGYLCGVGDDVEGGGGGLI